MKVRELAIEGALEFSPTVFADQRGLFVSPLQEPAFSDATGAPFRLARSFHSTSRRGVLRGIHFTTAPPGCAKYIHCARGRALNFVVDLREGSPSFGRWDAVDLDEVSYRAIYLTSGLGHAFVALEDDTDMVFLCTAPYRADDELSVNPLDPEIGLPVPAGLDPVRSDRDTVAPTLAQALADGLLPRFEDCRV
ncbi:dTDP-4-dehydrorhamnose 3,5-epimerase family protein [Kutzneria sp. NPDC052558]|uniref:dTDP-4-dehydrorhamnose 3,5-epimerase family protein n=1 Tax=Kutzneria sp. NPDC052558 TaxID=3364121 RepID=UPI0037CB1B9F